MLCVVLVTSLHVNLCFNLLVWASNSFLFFFSSRRRHTRSVSAFLLNRSSDLGIPAEPLFRSNAHNDKSVHGVLNPTYQAGLRRDAVQPDIEAERKKRDEIEAGKSYCSRRFGGATCDDKS